MKYVECVNNDHAHASLTIGKVYEVVEEDDRYNTYSIVGDSGIENTYARDRFKDVSFKHDEVDELIASRSNGTYDQIAEDAKAIMDVLGQNDEYTYFYSQIANKLARLKHRYSEEDSLLDIAGYAKLELDRFRRNE